MRIALLADDRAQPRIDMHLYLRIQHLLSINKLLLFIELRQYLLLQLWQLLFIQYTGVLWWQLRLLLIVVELRSILSCIGAQCALWPQ